MRSYSFIRTKSGDYALALTGYENVGVLGSEFSDRVEGLKWARTYCRKTMAKLVIKA